MRVKDEHLPAAAVHRPTDAIGADNVGYAMADAPRALSDLAHGRFSGAAVLCLE